MGWSDDVVTPSRALPTSEHPPEDAMSQRRGDRCLIGMSTDEVTVVGGGLAGLVAAVTAAEGGAAVRVLEAHDRLGGRARSTAPPHVANDGPHVVFADGAMWAWLVHRDLARPFRRLPMSAATAVRFRRDGRARMLPPAGVVRLLARRGRQAPVDLDFRTWVASLQGPDVAEAASALAGVVTFAADPGRLSAAFVWERLLRASDLTGGPRYVVGGWGALVDRLERHARSLGVVVETGARVTDVPPGPVVVATSLPAARVLLRRDLPSPATSGSTMLLDVALSRRRGDAFLVSDLDEAGWVGAYSRADATLAPRGEVLVQAQRPLREGESHQAGTRALEELLEVGAPGWRGRTLWRRDAAAHHRSGALDLPGYTWRDRPAVDQGDGVFLAGDEVAARGLLAEVSCTSAVRAAHGALDSLGLHRRAGVPAARR